MSGRDFGRLVTLANIGLRAAGVRSDYENKLISSSYTWKNQLTFISQCHRLFTKAYYWKILKYFNVSFDPNCFEETNKENDKKAKPLVESKRNILGVLSKLITQASKSIILSNCITDLAVDFAENFGVDSSLAIESHIESLLTWSKNERSEIDVSVSTKSNNLRRNLVEYKKSIKDLLALLTTQIERVNVLRRSLISLEKIEESGRDFDHYSLVLSLYHTELRGLIAEKSGNSNLKYIEEIDRIDRRLDALAIISSFFEEKPYNDRPLFQKCFIPLHETNRVVFCGVLGSRGDKDMIPENDLFDPLLPVSKSLRDEKSVSALAPLCTPLGLPTGFVHARSLVERLDSAKKLDSTFPSFQSQVLPTIKRIKKPKDGAQLAEWCANQYPHDSSERLKCLELAHTLAIKSSTEAEIQRRQSASDSEDFFALQERNALDTLKRITDAKSVLADQVIVTDCLKKYVDQKENFKAINKVLTDIITKVKQTQIEDPAPEKFVENLLIEGSLLAAEASLDRMIGISENDFFILSLAIHLACKRLEDRYSHIDVEVTSRDLVRRWLLHGDDMMKPLLEKSAKRTKNINRMNNSNVMNNDSICIDEEDTKELILDLKALTSSEEIWSDELKSSDHKKDITADEEPSSLKASPHGRETSEYLSARVGLRVAFILFGENQNFGLKSHARYLLKIVFAKSSLTFEGGLKYLSPNTFPDKRTISKDRIKANRGGSALTFAMRYRALRAVSVLCDEKTLRSVIEEDKYFDTRNCSFSQCCFGSLLAKEIESMGLSLPHSDLEQLSVMHHPSYARTLWKHFRHSNCNGYKGRYLLLLLELSLREEKTTLDMSLLKTILLEIVKDDLPRTMLLSCECLAAVKNLRSIFTSDKDIAACVLKLSKKLTASILNEIDGVKKSIDMERVVSTVHRLGKAVQIFLQNGISSDEVIMFVSMLCKIAENSENSDAVSAVYEVASSISFQLNQTKRTEAFSIMKSTKNGHDAIFAKTGDKKWFNRPNTCFQAFNCFDKMVDLEEQHNFDIASDIQINEIPPQNVN